MIPYASFPTLAATPQHPASALLDDSLENRLLLYKAECHALWHYDLPWQEQLAGQKRLRLLFGISQEDLLAHEFGTQDMPDIRDTLDTDVPPHWLTPELLSECEREAAKTLDYPTAPNWGEEMTCPIHHRVYTIVKGDPTVDCDACFEEVAQRQKRLRAIAVAKQELALAQEEKRDAEIAASLPSSLPLSGVEVQPGSFEQARRQEVRTFWGIFIGVFGTCGLLMLLAKMAGWL